MQDREIFEDGMNARAHGLADAVDRELDADRRFFERRPRRSYRLRRSFPTEGEQVSILLGGEWPVRGGALFTAVRQLAPGVRARVFFLARRDLETDVSDAEAAECFNYFSTSTIPDDIAKAIAATRADRRS